MKTFKLIFDNWFIFLFHIISLKMNNFNLVFSQLKMIMKQLFLKLLILVNRLKKA